MEMGEPQLGKRRRKRQNQEERKKKNLRSGMREERVVGGGGETMGWLWIREHNDRGAHSLSGITTLPPLVCLSDEN